MCNRSDRINDYLRGDKLRVPPGFRMLWLGAVKVEGGTMKAADYGKKGLPLLIPDATACRKKDGDDDKSADETSPKMSPKS